jgi:hypothetical protein
MMGLSPVVNFSLVLLRMRQAQRCSETPQKKKDTKQMQQLGVLTVPSVAEFHWRPIMQGVQQMWSRHGPVSDMHAQNPDL